MFPQRAAGQTVLVVVVWQSLFWHCVTGEEMMPTFLKPWTAFDKNGTPPRSATTRISSGLSSQQPLLHSLQHVAATLPELHFLHVEQSWQVSQSPSTLVSTISISHS
jgi:hypothetical protein